MARISTRQLAQVCRRTGLALRAGVDIRRVWEQEALRGDAAQRQQMDQISRHIAAGDSLASAMKGANGYFPRMACELVDVGEQTGRVEEVLLRLADHYDHMLSLRRIFLLGILWPGIQLAAAIGVIGFLIWILGILAPPGGDPMKVLGLSGNSGLLIYISVIALIAGSITVVVLGLMRGWFGPAPLQVVMRLPSIGTLLQTMALARLTWSLAMALEAGVDARRSVQLAMRSTQNPYYTNHLEQADRVIARGGEFHEALRQTGAFPSEFLDALHTAEIAGTHSDALMALSREYQSRAETASRMLTVLAGFAVWGLVALVLIILIFQFFFTFILGPINEGLEAIQ